ncbi:MAG: DEAD/DEAH box helicase family protein [Lentisphaeria bacterium]|nr:DEAD/DEAH box helicase family protein [Lentisphaeria bacterium]
MSFVDEKIQQSLALATEAAADSSASVAALWPAVEECVSAIFQAKGRELPADCTPLELVTNSVVRDFLDDGEMLKELNFVRLLHSHALHDRHVKRTQALRAREIVTRLWEAVRLGVEHPEAAKPAKPLTEYETRKLYIDYYLEEAGWPVQTQKGVALPGKACIEIKVTGMPNAQGEGFCDYVLFGKDGKPLAVVEAKKTSVSPEKGRTQVLLYGRCLEEQYGVMPVLYYTNGYEIWCMDGIYGERPLTAFHTRRELERMLHRRSRKPIADTHPNTGIAGRPYQIMAITSLCQHLCNLHRRGLLVMATGTGKTRTAIALTDVLTRSNWVERVLFLADRTPLVSQAFGEFAKLLPSMSYSVLSDEKYIGDPDNARIMFSTYQTMIHYVDDAEKRFTPGRFDLIIVDEAHRSIFNKYGAIFDYFDALLVGLTATPKDDVDRNTYLLFDRENGVPNFDYSYKQAVAEGHLVPFKLLNRTTALLSEGISYKDLAPEERAQVDEAYEGEPPERIESSEFFHKVYNVPTCDRVIQDLVENGLKVDDGDTLGKSIIFAVNHKHADMIVKCFQKLYPNLGPECCRLIDNYENYSQTLLNDFKEKPMPRIAVSVDMLDTGVDVPSVVNLVFFKKVRSKTKFIQMIGRGTRLCPDLYGPGLDKKYFRIFDYCGNFQYFGTQADGDDAQNGLSLSQKLFALQLRLVYALQDIDNQKIPWRKRFHDILKAGLYDQLKALFSHRERIQVRQKLSHLDRFIHDPKEWQALNDSKVREIESHIVPLLDPDTQEDTLIKLFDARMFRIEMPLANHSGLGTVSQDIKAVQTIALKLSKLGTIQDVVQAADHLHLVAEASFWNSEDVQLEKVEELRLVLRPLMPYLKDTVEAVKMLHVHDILQDAGEVEGDFADVRTYRMKVIDYLVQHDDLPAVRKIKCLEKINSHDLKDLEEILWDKLGTREDYAKENYSGTLAGFVRSIVSLDSQAVQEKFGEFLTETVLNAEQQEFVKSIIDYLKENGEITKEDLQESPFNNVQIPTLFRDKLDVLMHFMDQIQECQKIEDVA